MTKFQFQYQGSKSHPSLRFKTSIKLLSTRSSAAPTSETLTTSRNLDLAYLKARVTSAKSWPLNSSQLVYVTDKVSQWSDLGMTKMLSISGKPEISPTSPLSASLMIAHSLIAVRALGARLAIWEIRFTMSGVFHTLAGRNQHVIMKLKGS